MLQKDGSVIFSEWNKGQAKHPIYGFGLLQNVEIFENKGIVKLKNRTVARSSIAPTQLPIAEVRDISGNTYTLTGSTGQGKVYKNGTLSATHTTNIPNAADGMGLQFGSYRFDGTASGFAVSQITLSETLS